MPPPRLDTRAKLSKPKRRQLPDNSHTVAFQREDEHFKAIATLASPHSSFG